MNSFLSERILWLLTIAATAVGGSFYQQVAAAEQAPNVLFIAIDDLRTELGCYGVKDARSPNLDALAAQAMLFTNHFVQVPTCGASRYALLTGRSPQASGVTRNNAAFYQDDSALSQQQTPGAQTMPELFRRSGYATSLIGKISHTADGLVYEYDGSGDGRLEMPHAWETLATPLGSWKRGWGIFFAYESGRSREDGGGHLDLMEFTAENDSDLPDGQMADAAIAELGRLKQDGRPFFMGLGFIKPHLPFVAPKQDWEAMMEVDVQPPAHPQKPESAYWHKSGEFYKYDAPYQKSQPLAAADAITARRAYLACVRYADRQVGKVLKALDDNGLAENTIVVVWGDHGWFLGETAMWAKHAPLERALRSTLIVRAPGMPEGKVTDALVETIDLYPTLIDLCQPGFTKTEWPLDGESLVPLLKGETESVRDFSLSYWGDAVSVRTRSHRLSAKVNHKSGDEFSKIELYDIRDTPDPVENLVDSEPELVEQLLGDIAARR